MSMQELDSMSGLEQLGERLFKLRDYTPIPLIVLAVIFAVPSVESLIVGLITACVGEITRIYGVAFIGTISRTRSYSNGDLITQGPFALFRNPLYLGNLLMVIGLSLMTGVWWLPLVAVIVFYAQYIPIVAWEEKKLTRIFGSVYQRYQKDVPRRWFPSFFQLLKGNWYVRPDSWKPALRSEKRTLTSFVVFSLLMSFLFWQNLHVADFLPLKNHIIKLFYAY